MSTSSTKMLAARPSVQDQYEPNARRTYDCEKALTGGIQSIGQNRAPYRAISASE